MPKLSRTFCLWQIKIIFYFFGCLALKYKKKYNTESFESEKKNYKKSFLCLSLFVCLRLVILITKYVKLEIGLLANAVFWKEVVIATLKILLIFFFRKNYRNWIVKYLKIEK